MMRTIALTLLGCVFAFAARAQKVDSIYFHLYTDSLKKGFYNYISVDGKLADGSWMPLDSSHIILSSNAGAFVGNDLFIDSSWTEETVKVKAVLRNNPRIQKQVVIYIRKRGFDEALKTDAEVMEGARRRKKS